MSDPGEREQRLERLMAEYLEAARAGQTPPREQWLGAHPDLADDLRRFLDNHQWMQRPGTPSAESTGEAPPTVAASMTPFAAPPGVLRSFGDYELLQEIARGGMGVVYRARQVSLNRVVALKMIL